MEFSASNQPQRLPQTPDLATRHRHGLAVLAFQDHVGFAAFATQLMHRLQVDDETPVYPHELRRVESQMQIPNA
jgi:hypothetical protein